MPYVYKYVDDADGICKYVGMTGGNKFALRQRIYAHKKEAWTQGKQFSITCFQCHTQSEAEAFESHFIAVYGTSKYYNIAKSDWGINNYLNTDNIVWKSAVDVINGCLDYSEEMKAKIRQHRIVGVRVCKKVDKKIPPVDSLKFERDQMINLDCGLRLIRKCEECLKSRNDSYEWKREAHINYAVSCSSIQEWLLYISCSRNKYHLLQLLTLWGVATHLEIVRCGYDSLDTLIKREKKSKTESLAENTLFAIREFLNSEKDKEIIHRIIEECPYRKHLCLDNTYHA